MIIDCTKWRTVLCKRVQSVDRDRKIKYFVYQHKTQNWAQCPFTIYVCNTRKNDQRRSKFKETFGENRG